MPACAAQIRLHISARLIVLQLLSLQLMVRCKGHKDLLTGGKQKHRSYNMI